MKRASSMACTVGSVAFSLENGPPGMAFIAKKVMAAIISTVTAASSSLLIVYFSIVQTTSLRNAEHSIRNF